MSNIHNTLGSLFTDIANAIRNKTGGTAKIVADNFPTEIANIPSGGVDPSDATATESDILNPKTAYLSDGTKHTGSMADNGAVSQTLDTQTTSYTIPQGYHNGNGSVSVTTQTKSATPTGSAQTVSADGGKVLSSVNVEAVTKNSGIGQTLYNEGVANTKVGTASASDVLSGKTFTNESNVGATGSMTNRGAWTSSVTPSSSAQTVTIPQGYHNGNGYVSVGASSGGNITGFKFLKTIVENANGREAIPGLEVGKVYLLTHNIVDKSTAGDAPALVVPSNSTTTCRLLLVPDNTILTKNSSETTSFIRYQSSTNSAMMFVMLSVDTGKYTELSIPYNSARWKKKYNLYVLDENGTDSITYP